MRIREKKVKVPEKEKEKKKKAPEKEKERKPKKMATQREKKPRTDEKIEKFLVSKKNPPIPKKENSVPQGDIISNNDELMSKLLEIAPVENKSDHPDENVVNAAGANTTATVIAKTKKKKTTTCANCGNLGHYTPKCPLKVKTVTSTGPEEMHEIREIDDFKKLLVEERKINQDEIDLLGANRPR
jgi:hypothetical protein